MNAVSIALRAKNAHLVPLHQTHLAKEALRAENHLLKVASLSIKIERARAESLLARVRRVTRIQTVSRRGATLSSTPISRQARYA